MKPRKVVNEKLHFSIGKNLGKDYKDPKFCTWKDLIETNGPLSSDTLDSFYYKEEISKNWSDDMEDKEHSFFIPTVIVIRPRLENDDEYFTRMKAEETIENEKNEKERLEYLRLKAKFEKE